MALLYNCCVLPETVEVLNWAMQVVWQCCVANVTNRDGTRDSYGVIWLVLFKV